MRRPLFSRMMYVYVYVYIQIQIKYKLINCKSINKYIYIKI